MQRRTFLAASVSVPLAGFLAGCSSSGGDDPEGVVEAFYDAFGDGDVDELNSLIHPDSPDGFIEDEEAAEFEAQTEEIDFSIESTELVEEGDDEAVVELTVEIDDSQYGTQTVDGHAYLRTDGGDWKIYELD